MNGLPRSSLPLTTAVCKQLLPSLLLSVSLSSLNMVSRNGIPPSSRTQDFILVLDRHLPSNRTFQVRYPPTGTAFTIPSRLGETVDEVHARVETFLQDFLPLRPKGERLLIVSHAATIAALVRLLSEERDMPVRIGCCSLSQFHKNGNTWTRVKTADGSHLSGGSLRDWGFQDIEVDNGRVVNDPGVPGSENEKNEPVGSVVSKNSNVNVTSSL
ncbi:hypothetical protein EDD18DRAFT_19635 [Armillaria luteobubalina]|uniref:Phosphoglycerate mutase-like protein n=1 Tax=Armillaria luteobubalina TaxID=153913 RepID=A0AA39QR00_9AGAR|nr:hypothetical protein EDD18DRAFT_19635 [Armillaria luteobubalina]